MTTALGWKSAIYSLAHIGDMRAPAMIDVAQDLATAASTRLAAGSQLSAAEHAVHQLGAARTAFSDVIARGAAGADDATLATGFADLAERLKGITSWSGPGTVVGPVGHARSEATQVASALRDSGGASGTIGEATHMRIWSLRNALDDAWGAVGTAKVLGHLGR